MGRSSGGSGCFGVIGIALGGAILGMAVLAIGLGILTITVTDRDGGFDIGFDIASGPEEVVK